MTCFSNYLRTQIFKATQDCDLTDGTINLLTSQNWLERWIKDLFNPLAGIIFKKQEQSTSNLQKKILEKIYSNLMNASDDKKESKRLQKKTSKMKRKSV